ncbi:hypothetical protein FIBSPDRAFT_1053580, partial [Athelia psychrophila]
PSDAPQVVHIDSLEAALAKLNVNVPIKDLLKLIHEEDEAKRAAAATQCRTALSNLALRPPEQTAGLQFTTISRSIPDLPKHANVDPLAKERRLRLRELSEQTFPDGKVPELFALTSLALSQDVATKGPGLPVILATRIVATNAIDTSQYQIQPAHW